MRLTGIRFITLVALLTIVLSSGGMAGADRVAGVTDDTITIGILTSLTGPAAIWGSGQHLGAAMYFTKVNAAGGIHGRKLKWVVEDDATSPPKGIAGYKKLVSDGVFVVFGPAASGVVAAARPTIDAGQTPTFMPIASTPRAVDPFARHVFRTGSLNDSLQGVLIADFIVKELKGKRVAIVRQSDEYGKRGGDGIAARLKGRYALDLVADEMFNLADTDFTSQLLRIRAAKADVLVVYGFVASSATIVRQARQLGVEAKIIGSNATSSRLYPQVIGESATGVLNVITAFDLPESNAPAMKAFREEFERAHPALVAQGRPDLMDVFGYGGAMALVEGLRRAGRDLTPAKFIAALETLRQFETGITLPTTFTPTDHDGNKSARILEIRPGGTRQLLDVILKAE